MMNALNRKRLNCFLRTAFMVIALISCSLTGCASETGKQDALTRLDDEGYLYYMDYEKDYYSPEVMDAMREAGFIDPGCSVFVTHNIDGEPITCRNYDYPHRVSQEDRSLIKERTGAGHLKVKVQVRAAGNATIKPQRRL